MQIFLHLKNSLLAFVGAMLIVSMASAQVNDAGRDFSYALKLYNQKFYDLAAQQFIKYYNAYPESDKADEARYYSGMSLFILGDYAKARVEFQSLALEFPRSPRSPEGWFKTGECYEKLNDPSEAAKAFETVKILYPQDALAPEALYRSGRNYRLSGSLSKAENVLHGLRERYPGSTPYNQALLELARVFMERGLNVDAAEQLQKVLDTSSDPAELAEAYYLLGVIDLNSGYAENAIKHFTTVLERFPASAQAEDAALALAQSYLISGQAEKVPQYTAKIPADKMSGRIQVLNGDAYFLQERYALAASAYEKAETDKDSLALAIALKHALALRRQNLKTKGRELLNNALLQGSSAQSLNSAVSNIYFSWLERDGEYDQALAFTYQRMREAPSSEEYIVRLAEVLYKAKRWQNLVREIAPQLPILTRHPALDDLHFYLAVANKALKEYDECAYHLRQILDQFPASIHYEEADALYANIVNYHLVDQSQTIKSVVDMLATMNSGTGNTSFRLGRLYYDDLKDYNNARTHFEQALQKGNRPGDAHLYIGKTLLKMADAENSSEAQSQLYMNKAAEAFTKSVENISTCSEPDEASWLMVQTKINIDTISLEKQKSYIETLIKKYPQSPLREQWYENLAHTLAFDTRFIDDAEEYFKKLISEFKESERYPSYLFGYARLKKSESPAVALEIYKQIALSHANSRFAVLALQEVIQSLREEGQYAGALQLLERMKNIYFYSEEAEQAGQEQGELTFKAGQYEETVAALAQVVRHPFRNDLVLGGAFLDENYSNNVVYLGLAHARLGHEEEARSLLSDYLRLAPQGGLRDLVSFELAELYRKQNKKLLAQNYYEKVSKEAGSMYGQARLSAADIYFEEQQFDKAAAIYDDLARLFRGNDAEKEIRGKFIICKIKTGAIAESENFIKEYKRSFPDENDYLARFTLELGDYHRRNKNFDRAINSFNAVKRSYKRSSSVDDAEYYTTLTYITLNKYEDAFEILTNFEKNYPGSDKIPWVLNTLGTLHFRTEKYDAAIATFKTALQRSKDDELSGQVMSNLIKTYTLTGFWDAAQGLAREYIEKYPRAEDRLDKKLVVAQAFINLNQFQNAVEYLKTIKLEADTEREPEIQFYIGEAYLKAGQYEEAIAEFVKIPLMSKKTKLQWEASALYYSGQAYEKLGRISDAVRMYQEILDRPGIDLILKRDAEKRINQIKG